MWLEIIQMKYTQQTKSVSSTVNPAVSPSGGDWLRNSLHEFVPQELDLTDREVTLQNKSITKPEQTSCVSTILAVPTMSTRGADVQDSGREVEEDGGSMFGNPWQKVVIWCHQVSIATVRLYICSCWLPGKRARKNKSPFVSYCHKRNCVEVMSCLSEKPPGGSNTGSKCGETRWRSRHAEGLVLFPRPPGDPLGYPEVNPTHTG